MWQLQGLVALDLAHERAREARAQADQWRRLHDADEQSDTGDAQRDWSVRAVVARPVRAFSDATHALSDAACEAATRIEGRTA
jgi:hypothetical protein